MAVDHNREQIGLSVTQCHEYECHAMKVYMVTQYNGFWCSACHAKTCLHLSSEPLSTGMHTLRDTYIGLGHGLVLVCSLYYNFSHSSLRLR